MSKEYKVGDIVEVSRSGATHTTYDTFFEEYGIEVYKPFWHMESCARPMTHVVLYKEPKNAMCPIYVLLNVHNHRIYLVNSGGISENVLKLDDDVSKIILESYNFILSKFDSNFVIRLPKGERDCEQ